MVGAAALGLLLAAACRNPQPSEAQPESTSQRPAPHASSTAKPTEYHVRLDALPAPYATSIAGKPPRVVPRPAGAALSVPAGFRVNEYAKNLERPRWLALSPEGDVLVTETRKNRIARLRDRNGDGVADQELTFADVSNGLEIPFGMAFAGGSFFVGNHNAVRRYPYRPGQTRLRGTGKRITTLPGGGYMQHWTRNVIVGPDGKHLFVSIGSKSNIDEEKPPRASILHMRLDGSERETWADGLRNPVGLAVHPKTGDLYTTVNERDGLGDDLVPDYFTRVQRGQFFGWPYAYLTPSLLDPRHLVNKKSRRPDRAAATSTPDVLFQAHSAALGVTFYCGDAFPARYRDGAFVAFRGSWNRNQGTGYKIVYVPFDDKHRPVGTYEDFVTGFLIDPSGPKTWGRPVGLVCLPDGSLLFTEEANGFIYRVSYAGSAAN